MKRGLVLLLTLLVTGIRRPPVREPVQWRRIDAGARPVTSRRPGENTKDLGLRQGQTLGHIRPVAPIDKRRLVLEQPCRTAFARAHEPVGVLGVAEILRQRPNALIELAAKQAGTKTETRDLVYGRAKAGDVR